MGKKTAYDDLVESLKLKVKEKKATGHSNTALYQITNMLLNTPEQEITTIVAEEGKPVPVTTQPVREHRNALKSLVKSNFGLSDEELAKLDEATLPKNYTNSVIDVGIAALNGYLDTGKKFTLPMTNEDSTRMSIQKESAPERTREKRRIDKQEDGTYVSTPTGEMLKTKERTVLRATNKVPPWLMIDPEEYDD